MTDARLYDMVEVAEGSASPTRQTRHTKRKSDGAVSIEQLQKGLSDAGVANVDSSASDIKKNEGVASGPLSGKLGKVGSTFDDSRILLPLFYSFLATGASKSLHPNRPPLPPPSFTRSRADQNHTLR